MDDNRFAFIIFILFISFQTVAIKASQCVAAVRPNWVTSMAILRALIDIIAHRSDSIPFPFVASQGVKGLSLGWLLLGPKARRATK